MLEVGEAGLAELKLDLDKHRKIVAAAREIADGRLDLEELARPGVHYGEARLRLMGCEGIGPKIADCIALFALDKLDAFPVDRWVRRAIRSRYFGGRVPSDQELVAWAFRRPPRRTAASSRSRWSGISRRRSARTSSTSSADRERVRGILVAGSFDAGAVMAARAVPGHELRAYSFEFAFAER